ncbi:MAG: OmpH family outer membrane protein [Chitinophagales bacterium]|nr:OmpH family outer membrane protein [Bacteroidota bacterium]MBK8683389.1 OmpH family outer membrane protein [Bacteroidota bacterium]
MKKILLTTIVLFTVFTAFSQRFAYVNTEYILSNMAEFSDAQKKVDTFSEDWRAEIARQQKDIDDTYRAFQNEQYLLTEEVKKSRIQEIENKERALKEYQKVKFGYEGELFQKREELIKPIQDKVYTAIEKLAKERGYDFIFDKANSTTILFADTKNDRSDDVLRSMGITPGQNTNK